MKLFKPLTLAISFVLATFSMAYSQGNARHIYEIKVYHLEDQQQFSAISSFLKNAYISFAKDQGIDEIGVFEPLEADTLAGKRIYVFTPFTTLAEYGNFSSQWNEKLKGDIEGAKKSGQKMYMRYETTLLKAFAGMPGFEAPALKGKAADHIFELRSYESPTDFHYHNKVRMFNEGEVEIFDRLGFNAVFYAEVLAGATMPNLMYMTSFDNAASQKSKWQDFGKDSAWVGMKNDPQFQNNVSSITISLLKPMAYSPIH